MEHKSNMTKRLARDIGRSIFGEDASGYASGRLGYPEQLYQDLLRGIPDISRLSIFEVGPGTGLATRDLLARRPRCLVAIEPDARLAAFLSGDVGDEDGRFYVDVAPFEETGLDSETFDIGIAASCFHWVDPDRGWANAYRLLRPGGRWALWWNVYRSTGVGDSFVDAAASLFDDLELPPSEGPTRHISLEIDHQRGLLEAAGFVDVETFLYRRERMLDARKMRELYASFSFVRRLSEPDRQRFLDSISALVDEGFGGAAPNVVLTPLYIAIRP